MLHSTCFISFAYDESLHSLGADNEAVRKVERPFVTFSALHDNYLVLWIRLLFRNPQNLPPQSGLLRPHVVYSIEPTRVLDGQVKESYHLQDLDSQ